MNRTPEADALARALFSGYIGIMEMTEASYGLAQSAREAADAAKELGELWPSARARSGFWPRHFRIPGSDRTKRLRKKRAKSDGTWPIIAAQAREAKRLRNSILKRSRKRPDHRRTPGQIREDMQPEANAFNGAARTEAERLRRQIEVLEAALAADYPQAGD